MTQPWSPGSTVRNTVSGQMWVVVGPLSDHEMIWLVAWDGEESRLAAPALERWYEEVLPPPSFEAPDAPPEWLVSEPQPG